MRGWRRIEVGVACAPRRRPEMLTATNDLVRVHPASPIVTVAVLRRSTKAATPQCADSKPPPFVQDCRLKEDGSRRKPCIFRAFSALHGSTGCHRPALARR